MKLNYILQASALPKTKALLKAILKPAEQVGISVTKFIELWGPDKISSFVSIGANDGQRNDPLFDFIEIYHWKGILVEPMPENFRKLKANHQHNTNLAFENVGIVKDAGVFDFYHIKDIQPEDPDWYSQISSFDKETFYKNISEEVVIADRIGISQIPGITFQELMDRNNLTQVDLIMIDTEGYDYKILSSIDLKKYGAKMIVFEYEWLTNYEVKLAKRQLEAAGYRLIFSEYDCVAIKR